MKGRARAGGDARGTIGDIKPKVELIDDGSVVGKSKRATGGFHRRTLGLGLLIIVIGLVIWLWPIFDFWVLSFVGTLSTGPKIVAYGILVIIFGIIANAIVPIILDFLFD